jgi:hypothetical protein
LFITTDVAGQPARSISVTGNAFESPSPVTSNLVVITTNDARHVVITGNSARGWGDAPFVYDFNDLSTGLVAYDNDVSP